MSESQKILVTGATGNVGSLLIPKLTSLGAGVRTLTRDKSKAQGLEDAGVEVVIGDLEKPETLDAAFRGVGKVFLVTPPESQPGHSGQIWNRSCQAQRKPGNSQIVGGRCQRHAWRIASRFGTAR